MCDQARRGAGVGLLSNPMLRSSWAHAVRSFGLACLFVWALSVGASEGEDIVLPHGAVSLVGTLELAPGRALTDGVVLMVHGSLAHKDMRVMREFRTMFAENGFNTLAVNLSLGLDRRSSEMYDCAQPSIHMAEDALDEIGAWLDWLAEQGVPRATVLGHSRGGYQVAWFAVDRSHPLVTSYILLAPAIAGDTPDAARYEARHDMALGPVLEQAHELMRSGRGNDLLEGVAFMHCGQTDISAASFLSYYAPEPTVDTPELLKRIAVPTLVLVAGMDEVVRDGEVRLGAALNEDVVKLEVIAGADHFFHDLFGEDAMDAITAFLE
jgi:pimeloyl-ACP methyl ester carboxylesterase